VQVEDEMTDTQSQMAAFKRKVKDDVGQLEKRLRALASKVATSKVTGVAVAAVVPAYLVMICVWQNATVSALLLVYFSNTGLARGTG
jgi:hypothetical protein